MCSACTETTCRDALVDVPERVTTPIPSKDPSSGYVPDIPAPPPVFQCSGHRCRRRRRAQYVAAANHSKAGTGSLSASALSALPHSMIGGASSNTDQEAEAGRAHVQNGTTSHLRGRMRRIYHARHYYEETVLRRSATDEREAFSSLAGGRYMCVRLDKRCWLEVEDPRHRYAKNLRRYHHEWAVRRGRPESSFWTWLDSKQEAISLPSCGREKLETEVVRYCSVDADRRKYALRCLDSRLMTQLSCESVSDDDAPALLTKNALSPTRICSSREVSRLRTNGTTSSTDIKVNSATAARAAPSSGIAPSAPSGSRWRRLTTGPKGWIFVLHDGVLYARYKGTHAGSERFHHSSFFGGECVDAAGVIVAKDGVVTRLLPHSGHYRPREAHFARLLLFLKDRLELDLNRVEVDVQRLMRQARPEHSRKTDTPLFWSAGDALAFLFWKAMAKSTNLLHDIELRRQHDDDDGQVVDYSDGAMLAERASIIPSTTALYGGSHHSQRSLSSLRRSSATHSRASLKAECQRDQLHLEERMLAANLGVGATLQGRAAEAAAAAAAAAANRSRDKTLHEDEQVIIGTSHVFATPSAIDRDVSTAVVVAADCGLTARASSMLSNLDGIGTFEKPGGGCAVSIVNAPEPTNDDYPDALTPKAPRPIPELAMVTTDTVATARRPRARSAESLTSTVASAEHWMIAITGQADSILSSWNVCRRPCKANTGAKSKHMSSIPLLRHLRQLATCGRSVSTPPPLHGDYWCPAESYSDGGRDGRCSDVDDSSSDDDTSSDRTGSEEHCNSLAASLADVSSSFGEKPRRDDASQSFGRRFFPVSLSSTVYSRPGSRVSGSDEENVEFNHPVVAENHHWIDLAINPNGEGDNPARSYFDDFEEVGFTMDLPPMDLPPPLARNTDIRPAT